MSPPTDTVRPPKDPAAYAQRRLMGAGFWLLLVFGAVCIAAGASFAVMAPRLFPAKAVAERSTPDPADAPGRQSLVAIPAASDPHRSAGLATDAVAGLAGRMSKLENDQARIAESAATTLAASALADAAQTSRPFAEELAAFAAVSRSSVEVRGLQRLAELGAPSRAALAQAFPDYAARAAAAARLTGHDAGPLARLQAALAQVVVVRRVGEAHGKGADALIAQAERQVLDGDIDRALKTMDGLPPAAREAMAPWRARAEQRVETDRKIGGLRAQALGELARIARRGE